MSDQVASTTQTPPTRDTALKRRGLLIGAGAVGAAAVAIKTLPGVAAGASAAVASAPKLVDTAGGYQLSAHVLRYYETTRA